MLVRKSCFKVDILQEAASFKLDPKVLAKQLFMLTTDPTNYCTLIASNLTVPYKDLQ